MAGEPTEPIRQQQETKQSAKNAIPNKPADQAPQRQVPDVAGLEPRQAMQELARKESSEQQPGRPVPQEWIEADRTGNSLWPQTGAGILLFLGQSVVDSMSSGQTSWDEFQQLQLTDAQIDELGAVLNNLHGHFRIPIKYNRHPAEGELVISPDNMVELWRREQYGVAALVFNYMQTITGAQEGITAPTFIERDDINGVAYQSISDIPQQDLIQLQAFFADPRYSAEIDLLKQLLLSAVDTMRSPSGQEDARYYRDTVAFKTQREIRENPNLASLKRSILNDLRQSLIGGAQNSLPNIAPQATEGFYNGVFTAGNMTTPGNTEL